MIVNLPTFLMLFVAGLAGLLGLGLAITGFALGISPGHEETPGEAPPGWRRSADAALKAGARSAMILTAGAWPLLYVTLASYVHRVSGAMCIYGVTQRATTLVHEAEIAWPTAILALGLYLLLARVDRDTPGEPNRHRNRWVLGLAGLVVAVTALQTVRYLMADKGGDAVSCCTTAQNLALGPGFFQYLGFTLPAGRASLTPYLLGGGGLTAATGLMGFFGARRWPRAVPLAGLLLVPLAIVAAAVTLQALFGAIAPRLLGLPFHHCVYCLLKHFIDGPIFIGAAFLGTVATIWGSGIALMADAAEAPVARQWAAALWRTATLLTGGSMLMVLVHWIAAGLR